MQRRELRDKIVTLALPKFTQFSQRSTLWENLSHKRKRMISLHAFVISKYLDIFDIRRRVKVFRPVPQHPRWSGAWFAPPAAQLSAKNTKEKRHSAAVDSCYSSWHRRKATTEFHPTLNYLEGTLLPPTDVIVRAGVLFPRTTVKNAWFRVRVHKRSREHNEPRVARERMTGGWGVSVVIVAGGEGSDAVPCGDCGFVGKRHPDSLERNGGRPRDSRAEPNVSPHCRAHCRQASSDAPAEPAAAPCALPLPPFRRSGARQPPTFHPLLPSDYLLAVCRLAPSRPSSHPSLLYFSSTPS